MTRTRGGCQSAGAGSNRGGPSAGKSAVSMEQAEEAFMNAFTPKKPKKKRMTHLERLAECNISEELRVSVALALKKLETTDEQKELELPSSLTADERRYIHIVAQHMGFKSKSRGPKNSRVATISKKDPSERPPRQKSWKQRALRYGGVEELLKQREERRRVRELQLENERLQKLEEDKQKALGYEDESKELMDMTKVGHAESARQHTGGDELDVKPDVSVSFKLLQVPPNFNCNSNQRGHANSQMGSFPKCESRTKSLDGPNPYYSRSILSRNERRANFERQYPNRARPFSNRRMSIHNDGRHFSNDKASFANGLSFSERNESSFNENQPFFNGRRYPFNARGPLPYGREHLTNGNECYNSAGPSSEKGASFLGPSLPFPNCERLLPAHAEPASVNNDLPLPHNGRLFPEYGSSLPVHGGPLPVHGGPLPVHGGPPPVYRGPPPVYGGPPPVYGGPPPVYGGPPHVYGGPPHVPGGPPPVPRGPPPVPGGPLPVPGTPLHAHENSFNSLRGPLPAVRESLPIQGESLPVHAATLPIQDESRPQHGQSVAVHEASAPVYRGHLATFGVPLLAEKASLLDRETIPEQRPSNGGGYWAQAEGCAAPWSDLDYGRRMLNEPSNCQPFHSELFPSRGDDCSYTDPYNNVHSSETNSSGYGYYTRGNNPCRSSASTPAPVQHSSSVTAEYYSTTCAPLPDPVKTEDDPPFPPPVPDLSVPPPSIPLRTDFSVSQPNSLLTQPIPAHDLSSIFSPVLSSDVPPFLSSSDDAVEIAESKYNTCEGEQNVDDSLDLEVKPIIDPLESESASVQRILNVCAPIIEAAAEK